jgi:nucleotide-binding universal stress UspA family protein
MEISKILFPTDLSDSSSAALSYAADLASRYGAKVYVVHVLYDIGRSSGWYVPHMSTDELYEDMEKEARGLIHRMVAEGLRGHKDTEYVVLRGVPYEEIIRFSEANGVDLIVMSTHGRKGLDRVIFGGTSEKVVRESHCPVLTVRPPAGS